MNIGMGLRLLETLTSALYEDPIVFFREYVQNSADAYIRNSTDDNFRIEINIKANEKKIEFIDNGYGIPQDKFLDKMTSIGKSDKSNAIDQIGFRGIGRLAAMPFCNKLIFLNKVENSNELQIFSWNGKDYNLLLSKSEEDDLEKAIEEITEYSVEQYTGNSAEHFFKVELYGYSEEIAELVGTNDFKDKLSRLLPLEYKKDFSAQDMIHEHYNQYMGETLTKYEFGVFLNGEQLFKPYTNDNILESDIVFWDLAFEQISEEIPREKIGILWFTFNRKVYSNPVDSPRGIFVRSKNMLLGNEYAVADAITKGSSDYVATYRELTQTLNGVYGELLIDTTRLSDNARRDWFRIDSSSNQLKVILVDYLKKLKAYRYSASQAFNDKSAKNKREKVIKAYKELTGGFDTSQFEKDFYDAHEESKSESIFLYADEDIPRRSMTSKKFYEEIMAGLKMYYVENMDELGMENFIKVRTFLKQFLSRKE